MYAFPLVEQFSLAVICWRGGAGEQADGARQEKARVDIDFAHPANPAQLRLLSTGTSSTGFILPIVS